MEEWVARYNGPGNSRDFAYAIALDGSGNVYVTGSVVSSEGWSKYTTIKYVQTPVSVEDEHASVPEDYGLSQNYPNPFNPTTTVSYSLPEQSDVSLIIYNLNGQEVTNLLSEVQQAGYHKVTWNASNFASGIYFYRFQAGDFVLTRKMVLLK